MIRIYLLILRPIRRAAPQAGIFASLFLLLGWTAACFPSAKLPTLLAMIWPLVLGVIFLILNRMPGHDPGSIVFESMQFVAYSLSIDHSPCCRQPVI